MTTAPSTVLIDGTIVQNKMQGITRKDAPKRTRQRRRVALPAFAADAVRRCLARACSGPDALLFPTKIGRPMSVSDYERLLRSFIEDSDAALRGLGVDVEHYSTHIYRRTVATLIERSAGLTIASRLLGHANEMVTRSSYVVTAEQVDIVTADILDTILGMLSISARRSPCHECQERFKEFPNLFVVRASELNCLNCKSISAGRR